jgi:hypothetical protein
MKKYLIILLVVLAGVSIVINYQQADKIIATVNSLSVQQSINGSDGSISTSYSYLVNTDKGVFEISPDGIYSSVSFGSLKEGNTYELYTRGFSYPLLGIYPHIIKATKKD